MRVILVILFTIISPLSFSQGAETIYIWPDKIQSDEGPTPTVLPDRVDGNENYEICSYNLPVLAGKNPIQRIHTHEHRTWHQ